ncbi:MAG: amidohydrolase family protein, partial [Nitrospinaceae bacterium]|nr:amidohydrolase family protein [Nitrospinaceae bacterium]
NLDTPPDSEIIEAADMIVMPGLVNAHMHTWQTGIRGVAGDWSLGDYMGHMHANLATQFAPEDLYLANLLGALNQINCGATSLFDWCHNNPTPEHTDRAIDGLEEAGIRALFAHGTPKPDVEKDGMPHSEMPHPEAEIKRLATGRLSNRGALVTLGMAIRGPDISTWEVAEHDVRLAGEYELVASAHMGGRPGGGMTKGGIGKLNDANLLGPAYNVVHGCQLTDDEFQMIGDAGATVSSCPEVEMQMGHGHPVCGRILAAGGAPSLGVDIESNISGDMFTVMRMALQHQRAADNQKIIDTGASPGKVSIAARQALKWATIEGARAMGLDSSTGTLTPEKQADLIMIRTTDLNLYPVNNAAEAAIFQAGIGNVDTVMIGGAVLKRGGKLVYPKLNEKKEALAESGRRILKDAGLA